VAALPLAEALNAARRDGHVMLRTWAIDSSLH
jgi:hypothetical protein